MSETVFVRVRSHRASANLKKVLDTDKLDWHWNAWEGNNFVLIPSDRLADARAIKGITLARPKRDLLRCWSFV